MYFGTLNANKAWFSLVGCQLYMVNINIKTDVCEILIVWRLCKEIIQTCSSNHIKLYTMQAQSLRA